MPRIGAGYGGGDWARIEEIINTTLSARVVAVYDRK
jgi:O-acetyl-ADP-ribose deacetylase (regulator of RNase III)